MSIVFPARDRIASGTIARQSLRSSRETVGRSDKPKQAPEREIALTIEKEVNDRIEQVRSVTHSEAEQRFSLELTDWERKIQDLASMLEEGHRKAREGSQQAEGETLEVVLEEELRCQCER